jgi:DNA-binding NarL/FixJ family response regulator
MRVVLVDEHAAYRQSFRIAISRLGPFEVIGEARGTREALDVMEKTTPDLAVADFILPDGNAASLARGLRRRRNRTPLMVLSRASHPVFVRDALRSGVRGFALKKQPLSDVLAAMKLVGAGDSYLGPGLDPQESSPGSTPLEALSPREQEILYLLVDARSTKEIAETLFVSPRTVDAHRLHINRKLGIRSPAELARLAAEHGLIPA